jgi:hypothetical protein
VCHKGYIQTVTSGAVQGHLNHGDRLGTCGQPCGSAKSDDEFESTETDETTAGISLYPNPSSNFFNVVVDALTDEQVYIRVFDDKGSLVEEHKNIYGGGTFEVGNNLSEGIYIVNINVGDRVRVLKAIKSW